MTEAALRLNGLLDPARALLLSMLRDLFPRWDIWLCTQGVWRAAGTTHINASTADLLLERLARADPDAVEAAGARFSADTS